MRNLVPRLVTSLVIASAIVAASAPARAQPAPAPPLRGDSWQATQRAGHGTLTIAYYYPLEGFAYTDASGKLTGLLIDMVEQLKSYLKNVRGTDVTLRFVRYDDFPRLYTDVRNGQGGVLGLAGTTINEARKKEVAFGPPFFSNVPVLVTNAAVPDLSRRDRIATEFAGFTALAFRGTTLEAILRRLKAESFPTLNIETVDTYQEIVQRLSRDPRAFAYLDLNIFWVARKGGAAIKRHRVADEPREEFAFILPLGSDWRAPLGEFFAANGGYRQSRAYRSLVIKHLGVELKELLDVGLAGD
jgi:putative glutamine transport system substrate-binding protein